jgi:hypothetical protein
MFRSVTFLVPLVFLSGSTWAAGFLLEDYVPADSHRHYLSITPDFHWDAGEGKDEGPRQRINWGNGRLQPNLVLNQGSERVAQGFSWSVSNTLAAQGSDSEDSTYIRDAITPALPLPRNKSLNSTEDRRWFLNALTRTSAKWYPAGRLSISPAFDATITLMPDRETVNRNWAITAPEGDSVRYGETHTHTGSDNVQLNLGVRTDIGYGRIQDVRFAESVLFLLDRLSEALGRDIELDPGTLHELHANVEARRKLRPFFDLRQSAIYDMESILQFLKERFPGETMSSRAILEMADEWDYAWRRPRESGWEIKAYPFARSAWNDNNTRFRSTIRNVAFAEGTHVDGDSLFHSDLADTPGNPGRESFRRYTSETGFGLGISADYKRPWRRFFQFNLSAFAQWSRVGEEYGTDQNIAASGSIPESHQYRNLAFAYPMIESGFEAGASWFPSTRSSLRAYLKGEGRRKQDYLGSKVEIAEAAGIPLRQKFISYAHTLGLNAEYFFGPRLVLRLSGYQRTNWSLSEDELNDTPWDYGPPPHSMESWYPQMNVDLGLTYYLF